MSYHILAVSADEELRRYLETTLESGADCSVDYAKDEEWAIKKLEKPCDLVITELNIPRNGSTPLLQESARELMPQAETVQEGGLRLAKWIQDEGKGIPCIILSPAINEYVAWTIKEIRNCEQHEKAPGWLSRLVKRVKELRGEEKPAEPILEIEIRLNPEDLRNKRAWVTFNAINFPADIKIPNGGPVDISIDNIESLKTFSEIVTVSEKDWQSALKGVGATLMSQIFDCDKMFIKRMHSLIPQARGFGNTRIRFLIDESIHPLALEAIFGSRPPSEEDDYWMLHYPIHRTIDYRHEEGRPPPLFRDPGTRAGPLNVLIIEAPTEGEIKLRNEKTHELKRLDHVHDECIWLENFLTSAQYRGRVKIGQVKRISKSEGEGSYLEKVQAALQERGQVWHIVHYSGHSLYDNNDNWSAGYIYFPGPNDQPESVNIDILGALLQEAQTRFVFLSSCKSSHVGFVSSLARYEIPTIVAFRWGIGDRMALEYTKALYEELFREDTPSVEYAFMKARKAIRDKVENNPIWAAAVLVMQY